MNSRGCQPTENDCHKNLVPEGGVQQLVQPIQGWYCSV